MEEKKLISVIVPCYNEEEVLPLFYKEITKVSAQMQEAHPELNFEYLFIDDGSKDRTLKKLRIMAKYDSRVRYLSFSRNFGKEAGIYAGLKESAGDYCVIMDADLQHPPAFLPKMYEAVASGYYDCATTRRVSREGESKVRSWFARRFYGIMNKISQTEIVDGAQDFRFMTRQMVDAVLSMTEYNRFSKGIFSWVGFRTKYLEYKNVERAAGKTSWSFRGLFRYSLEGMIGFSTAPLSISAVVGLITCLLGLIMLIFTVVKKVAVGDPVAGYPTLICTILLFGGLQLFCTGIVGLYLGKTFLEVKKRPLYIVRETEKNADSFPELPEPEPKQIAEKPAKAAAQVQKSAAPAKAAAPAKQAQKAAVKVTAKRVPAEPKDAALEKAMRLKEESDAEFDALVDAAFEEADAKKAAADAEKKAAQEAAEKKAVKEAAEKEASGQDAAEEPAKEQAKADSAEDKKEKFVVEINYDNDELYDDEDEYDDEDYDDEDYDDEDYDDEDYDDEDYDDEDYEDEKPVKKTAVRRSAQAAAEPEEDQPTVGEKAKKVLKSIGEKLKQLKDKIAAAFASKDDPEKSMPDDEYDDDEEYDDDYDDYDDDDYDDDDYDDDDYDDDDYDNDDYDDDDYDDDDYGDDDYDDDDYDDDDYGDDDYDDDDYDDDDKSGRTGYRSAH